MDSGLEGRISFDTVADFDWFRIDVVGQSRLIDVLLNCVGCGFDGWVAMSLFEAVPDPDDPGAMRAVVIDEEPTHTKSFAKSVSPGTYYLLIHNQFVEPLPQLDLRIAVR